MKLINITAFILFYLLCIRSGFASESILIDHQFSSQEIGSSVEYLEDTEGKLTINDLTGNQLIWKQTTENAIKLGYNKSPFWFHFTTQNPTKTNAEWYLEITVPRLNIINFYKPDNQGSFETIETGSDRPINQRDVLDRNFVFRVNQPPGNQTYYLNIQTIHQFNFSMVIWSFKGFIKRIHTQLPFFWIYYGLLIVMIVYNIFIFFSVKDRAYIYCAFFILFLGLLYLDINGFAGQYLWPGSIWWAARNGLFCLGVGTFWLFLYINSFLEVKKIYPRMYKLINYTIIYPSIPIALLVLLFIESKQFIFLIFCWIIYYMFVAFFLMILGVRNNQRAAKFLLLAFTIQLIGSLIYLLKDFAVVPYNFFTVWSWQIGSVIMVFLYSLGLADKISTIKRQLEISEVKIRIQNSDLAVANQRLIAYNQEILEKEKNFSMMLGQLPLPVLIIRDKKIEYINKSFNHIFGYSLEEIPDLDTLRRVFFPDESYRKTVASMFDKIAYNIAEGEIAEFIPRQIVSKSGKVLDIMMKITLINEIILVIYDDFTERKRTQELIIQNDKMISLGGLAAGMAHELNNPLGGIILAAQNIKRRLEPGLNANKTAAEETGIHLDHFQSYLVKRNIYDFLDGIKQSGKRASTIISDMLKFSRKSDSQLADANLAQMMDQSVELASNDYNLKKMYDFRHINIEREYEPDMQTLRCSETEIEQVFLNLLKNAAQAISEKEDNQPKITLRIKRENNTARIEVEDNGPGMDVTVKSRIFEPFYTTKPVGMGTGLGLSVSYTIITSNHNGRIEVESEPDKGTRFIIHLPF